ncbi:amino acid permease [Parendozoicomonas haliclonae]|uniref:Tyrosine-specific transport protein n=1 Tax=Parendozoicomonas haliclonae TaxID=1960125 RepID=A0A1X7AG98_9GAMM|nr:aromatic amino acid transport family protein [Parendozoicomonas haliclonae]SMA38137.1 Tyrosine-specific transport protein [Parendozoicomonas haliclonae]
MKNRLLGSTLIVAGTTIGAGMLALPLITTSVGLGMSVMLMLLVWAVSAAGGLLMAEAANACPEDTSLHGMAGTLLGRKGQFVSAGSSMFLYYALCAAYISGCSSQLQLAARVLFDVQLHSTVAALIVTAITAFIVSAGTRRVDGINRILFPLMLVALAVVLAVLSPSVEPAHLEFEPADLTAGVILATLPVLYTSFGFHVVVPSIGRYMDSCHTSVRRAVIMGSLLPVVLYLFWQLIVNGVLGSEGMTAVSAGDPVAGMVGGLAAHTGIGWISTAVAGFAALALVTSFLGVALGLYDYLLEACEGRQIKGRAPAISVTFLPPLAIAILAPGSFVAALGYAALALVFLAAFLPAAMVWKVRTEKRFSPSLIIVVVGGILIAGSQIGIATGMLGGIS